ncbi:MAG TPA: hypothetical protein ENJ56_02585 [Anaerolineae bacterium]|nr:hypothetical protein [Anaerolineae bacterium]
MFDFESPFFVVGMIAFSFMVIFPIFWMGIILLSARMTGWHKLAQRFAVAHDPQGEEFNFRSAQFGRFTNYSNILTVTVSFEGIALRPFFLFRVGHKTLLFPWDSVQELIIGNFFLQSAAEFMIKAEGGNKEQRIRIFGANVVESIQRNAPKKLLLNSQNGM